MSTDRASAPTSRPTASIVIPVWNQWEVTRACLESLRPTLGVRDEVIVVDNGSRDDTPVRLPSFPWLRVVTNAENRGFAKACNQGAAEARNDVVVLLNNDTILSGRWLDTLLAPFADETVGATGPMSNFVSGPQVVSEIGYTPGRMPEYRKFERSWREAHRGETTEVTRLVGFCLAVRRNAFDGIGGFDEGFEVGGFEDDDLCARLVDAGWRLLITHDSFVHHHGHVTFEGNGLDWFAIQTKNQERFVAKHVNTRSSEPLLSVSLIVKDEEERLGSCLASLRGLADEVVVYDTGSTDRTIDIARQAGAKVVEGHWDDDFARARNESLAACTGRWVLAVDADEIVEGDKRALRRMLSSNPAFDLGAVNIRNLGGNEAEARVALSHYMGRLVRNGVARWQNRLHEKLVELPGMDPLRVQVISEVSLLHSGYVNDVINARDKTTRNIRIAEADLEAADDDHKDELALNLARSLMWAHRHQDALPLLDRVRASSNASPSQRRAALRHGIETLLTLGRPHEAIDWIGELRDCSANHQMARFYEGTARLLLGETAEAARLLDGVEQLLAEDGLEFAESNLQAKRGIARAAIGDWAGAVEMLAAAVSDPSLADPVWTPLVTGWWLQERDFAELVPLVPETQFHAVVAQAVCAKPEAADAFAEALWAVHGNSRVLALAILLAPRLEISRVLEWSARARGMGAVESCPLIAVAGDRSLPGHRRVVAAAVAHGAFADPRSGDLVEQSARDVADEEVRQVFLELDELAPDLLPAFVNGSLRSRPRAELVAEVLDGFGVVEQAAAIHGYIAETWGDAGFRPVVVGGTAG